jgi:hypothetical protein
LDLSTFANKKHRSLSYPAKDEHDWVKKRIKNKKESNKKKRTRIGLEDAAFML